MRGDAMLVFQVAAQKSQKQDSLKVDLSGIVPKKVEQQEKAAKLEKEGDAAMKAGKYGTAADCYEKAALASGKEDAKKLWHKKASALIAEADSINARPYDVTAWKFELFGLYEDARKHSPSRAGEIDAKMAKAHLKAADYYLRGSLLGGNIEEGAKHFDKACDLINEAKESGRWGDVSKKWMEVLGLASEAGRVFNTMKKRAAEPEQERVIFHPPSEKEATAYKAWLSIHVSYDKLDW